MKPVKNLEGAAKWIMRLAVLAYLVSIHLYSLKTLDFANPHYLISFIFTLSGLLLVVGGLQRNPSLTIIAGIAITVFSCYRIGFMINEFSIYNNVLFIYLILASIGLFFIAKGNN